MFLSVDGTLFVQLINFAIFFAILNVLFLRPVGRAIAKRRAYIESVTDDYDRYQAEGNALKAEAHAVLTAARREAEQTASRMRADASNESAEISAEYAQRAAAIVHDADRTVADELGKARKNRVRLTGELAGVILSRALPELAR